METFDNNVIENILVGLSYLDTISFTSCCKSLNTNVNSYLFWKNKFMNDYEVDIDRLTYNKLPTDPHKLYKWYEKSIVVGDHHNITDFEYYWHTRIKGCFGHLHNVEDLIHDVKNSTIHYGFKPINYSVFVILLYYVEHPQSVYDIACAGFKRGTLFFKNHIMRYGGYDWCKENRKELSSNINIDNIIEKSVEQYGIEITYNEESLLSYMFEYMLDMNMYQQICDLLKSYRLCEDTISWLGIEIPTTKYNNEEQINWLISQIFVMIGDNKFLKKQFQEAME